MPYVYMLRCRDGSLYTGSAKNLDARVQKHQDGTGARYTRGRRPLILVWHTETVSWSEALKEEYRIKRLNRAAKESLIAGESANYHE
jgi:putative endonuclease